MTLISLRVVPHRPYIRLTYRPCFSLDQTMACFSAQTLRDTDNDSVEGIAFTRDTSVIMTGQFVTEAEVDWARVNSMGRWYKPWFYQHVRSYLARGEGEYTECVHIYYYLHISTYLCIYVSRYVPTLHFHQRHNKPCFWMSHIWLPWADGPLARLLTGTLTTQRLLVTVYVDISIHIQAGCCP